MTINNELYEFLRCPLTGQALFASGDHLTTEDAKQTYPLINGIPWLLPNPQNSIADWCAKLHHFHQILLQEIKELEQAIPQVHGPTQLRLKKLWEGKQHFLQSVTALLSPLVHSAAGNKAAYDALQDKAPNTQNLLSYESNLYRDWVWGEEENQLTAKIVLEQIGETKQQNTLVLGAGAGRLALDIHKAIEPEITIATDINPLLVLAAQKLLSGQDFPFCEFPQNPRKTEFVAVGHKLSTNYKKPDNFHFVFSDAIKPAFNKGAFDLVITPWFIDIQPLEFSEFLQQLNQYLPVGGSWINFGSLVFYQKRDAFCYSIEEVEVIAERKGFTISNIQQHEIPYLKSPYDAGYRMENVWSWKATKHTNVNPLPNTQTLPEWLLDLKKPIPKEDYFKQISQTHRIYAQLTAEIDGRTSIGKMAKKLTKQYRLPENEANELVRNFFIDLFNQNN